VNRAVEYLLPVAGRPRPWRGIVLGAAGLTVVTLVLLPVRDALSLAAVPLLYLVPVLVAAVTGGFWPALAGAVAADVLVNFLFVPPYHTLRVDSVTNVVVLVVYLLVAAIVAAAVEVAAAQRATAARRGVEAELLARVSAAPAAASSLVDLLAQVRAAYGMVTVALLEHDRVVERIGPETSGPPAIVVEAPAGLRLAAWGPSVFAEDRGMLSRLAAAAARLRENQRLADEAGLARQLAEVDRLRAALLNAVGHDLRTPLAGIKAAVSSLRQPDIDWAPADRAELLATVEDSTDRLVALVENLLSLSRLQAGVLSADPRPIPVDAVVAEAVLHTAGKASIDVDVPDDLPLVSADPGLLERVVANLLANAVAAGEPETPVRVEGRTAGDHVQLRIIDHGRGLPAADRDRLFAPFQRLNDTSGGGLGLGLAIARGFTEAMGGTLTPSDTPGRGLTMTVDLPVAT
jgi:two-component system sensor histidine kinase KdpD